MNEPHPIDVHVGQRIKARRHLMKMSQETMGVGLGLTFQQCQKYEKGTNRVSASRLHEIAALLKVPVKYFYEGLPKTGKGGDTVDAESSAMTGFVASKEGVRLLRGYLGIPDEAVKARVLSLVESLAGADQRA